MSEGVYFGRFDEAAFADSLSAADGDPTLRDLRARAFEAYSALPAPSAQDEEWRRTDPARIPFERVTPLPPPALCAGPLWSAPEHEVFDVVVTVSEEGIGIADRSGVLRAGRCAVERVEDRARRSPAEVAAVWRGAAISAAAGNGLPPDKIEAFIGAFAATGIWIEVAPGATLGRGILIHHRLRRPESLAAWRTVANVGAGGALTLVEWVEGGGAGGILASSREVYVAEGARARAIALQQAAPDATVLAVDGARVARDGEYDSVAAHLGGALARTKAGVELAGAGARARLGGIAALDGQRHIDQRTLQVHSAPDTTSDLLYRAIVKDTARSVFQGVIVARRGAQRIDAYQRNNNLILNDGARADSLPGLLIDADDLKCTHGSTIGHLDPEALFYLRSRGLSAPAARRLLIEAFAGAIVERLPHPPLRDRLRAAVAEGW